MKFESKLVACRLIIQGFSLKSRERKKNIEVVQSFYSQCFVPLFSKIIHEQTLYTIRTV